MQALLDTRRSRQLATPAWLLAHGPAVLLFEVGCQGRGAYESGHIPGAGYIDTCELEGGPLWNKVGDDAWLAVLLANGIRHDSTVILYGRNQLAAARAAHLMLYAGVEDVRLLDGGMAAWSACGYPLVSGTARPRLAARDFGCAYPARPDYLIDFAQASALQAGGDGVLASIRTWGEHSGAVSGYSYIAARGDIPGARWGRAGEEGDVNSVSCYLDPDGCLRAPAQIEAMWAQAGITRDRRVAFYCGTGWRASFAFVCAWLMGWERISVYDGGWCEWSRRQAEA
jgi:thiosulfate/3-mercaptopyruvate sulfurtransferase